MRPIQLWTRNQPGISEPKARRGLTAGVGLSLVLGMVTLWVISSAGGAEPAKTTKSGTTTQPALKPALAAGKPTAAGAEMPLIQAFLKKHCLNCHGPTTAKADLRLHTFQDEAAILKGRKIWETVVDMVESGEMPPAKQPRPTADEVQQFLGAIKTIHENAFKNAKPDPGRVTIRRLNRAEYNNTMRDLVGSDFLPAEDFPSDDIGHGFDNIGDVLSISPVLMERYVAAAEAVMQRAILPHPPKPPVRAISARYLTPGGANVPQTKFRPLTAGDLSTTFVTSLAGEYTMRSRCYGENAGDEPIRVAFLVNGEEQATFELANTAVNDKTAQRLEAKFRVEQLGNTRYHVKLLNPSEGENRRTLQVESIEVSGPADTRPLSHHKLLACKADAPKREQTREVLARFADRAYRRPASEAEVERLVKFAESVEAEGEKWEAAIQLTMQSVLVSPKFLFRVELDDRPQAPDAHPLDEFQLASRLSYFIWSSMPDDELFALAKKRELTSQLDAQVRRMLRDPKAQALVDNFVTQWLQIRRLKTFAPDAKLFPTFNEPLRAAMLKETELFFQELIREDGNLLDIIDGRYTYLNEPLARHYGIVDTVGNLATTPTKMRKPGGQLIRGPQFQRVALQGEDRGGVLTQASVLTVTSNPTRTSPVKRGRWVLEQILGTPPPPPPPNVPELAETEKAVLSGSLRQRMEQHRVNPNCASCHARMDPLGFAFENYNAIGAFRSKDGEFEIDPSGVLPDGQTLQGPAELKTILKGKKELFARCLTEKLLTFALGRGVEYYDKPALDRIQVALAQNDYRFSTLISEIAKSDPFRMRRGKDQTP